MNRIVLNNIKLKRLNSFSIVLTIAISIAAFIALFMLSGGLLRGLELNTERSGAQILCVPTDAEEELEATDILYAGAPVGAYMNADIAEEMLKVKDVDAVTVQFYGQTLSDSCCSTDTATKILGFDPATDWVISPFTDVDLKSGLADDEVVIGSNISGFSSGSGKVLNHEVKVKATLDKTDSYLDYTILMDINVVRNLAKENSTLSHYWEKYGAPENLCSAILVKTSESNLNLIAGKLKRYAPGDYQTIIQSSLIEKTKSQFNVIFAIMLDSASVLVVASVLQLIARASTLVWDRRSEFALFRAFGATKGDLDNIVIGELFLLSGIACILGIVLGFGLYFGMFNWLAENSSFPFSPLPCPTIVGGIIAIVAGYLIVTLISAIVPLRQASRIDPASAMNQVDLS